MGLFNLFKKKKKDSKETEVKITKAEEKNSNISKDAEASKKAVVTEKQSVKKTENVAPASKVTPAKEEKNSVKTANSVLNQTQDKKTTTTQKNESAAAIEAEAKPDSKANSKSAKKYTQPAPKAKFTPDQKTELVAKSTEPIEQDANFKGFTGRFEINKSKDGKKFFFNLYASNKVGIATSQMYSTAQNALNGVKSVIANAAKAPIEDQSLKKYEVLPFPKWEIYIDNGGKYRFRLSASNGNCVCHSQGYTTKTACKNGIDSIIRSSRNAEIDKTYITTK